MTMSAKDIKFPSLCISRDQTFEIVKNDIELEICSKKAFENGYFEGMKIFDSDGCYYIVEHAEILKYLPLYWGWNFLFMPRMVKVKLLINRQNDISINEFKLIVNTLLKMTDSVASDGADDIIKGALINAATPKRIISALSKL